MAAAALAIHLPKRFPYSIVWTPIPVLSWVAPFIGHVGICTSDGIIFDFAGPFFISVDNLAFGHPTRYSQLRPQHMQSVTCSPPDSPSMAAAAGTHSAAHSLQDDGHSPEDVAEAWDDALQAAADVYQTKDYQFMGNNCHCFVAYFLNSIQYKGSNRWGTVSIASHIFLQGHSVSAAGWAKSYLPFVLLLPISAVLGGLIALFLWLALLGSMTAYFMAYSCLQHTEDEDAAV
ncbi:hypothetical protein WJX74_007777 [Apatococcus lobatus]|uniref:Uncharacterized protein n=1 Tax=Apatococcus lobatus TaxID=904363 RepID=A0AAW1S6N4_9CHLO